MWMARQNDKGLYALVPIQKETAIRNQDVIRWSSFCCKLGESKRFRFHVPGFARRTYVMTTIEDPTPNSRRDLFDKDLQRQFTRTIAFWPGFLPDAGSTRLVQPGNRTASTPSGRGRSEIRPDRRVLVPGREVPGVFPGPKRKSLTPTGRQSAQYANDPNETQIQYDLYRIPFNDGKGGTPERVIGASENGMSNNFPKVSPDGKWIVFVQNRNGLLMRPDSQLYIVPFKGGQARTAELQYAAHELLAQFLAEWPVAGFLRPRAGRFTPKCT